MKRFVADHTVTSHCEEAIAPRHECFRPQRLGRQDWGAVTFIQPRGHLPFGL
jgi:hypothetical protein